MWLVVLPFIICLVMLFVQISLWQYDRLQPVIHLFGAGIYFVYSILLASFIFQHGIVQINMGNWPYPEAISFRLDDLSALMLMVVGFVYFAVACYQIADVDREERPGYYFACWLLLLGATGALCTMDLFNMYVWFEDMLIATFILLISHQHQARVSAIIKYVVLNLLATVILLFSIALLYGYSGQLNILAIHDYLQLHPSHLLDIILLLFALSLGAKAALFPVFFWLPAAYNNVSFSSVALFAALLTKISMYVWFRLLLQIFFPLNANITLIFSVIAGLTMIMGVLAAAVQNDFRKLLVYGIVSDIGYILMGLLIHTPLAIAGAIFFMVHSMIVKSNLLLIAGISRKIQPTSDLRHTGYLYQYYPLLSLLFFISAFSVAGMPPLSGFWGKLFIIKAGLLSGHIILAVIAVVASFFTLYAINKLWQFSFQKNGEYFTTRLTKLSHAQTIFCYSAVIMLTLGILFISFYPVFLYHQSMAAAMQLLAGG